MPSESVRSASPARSSFSVRSRDAASRTLKHLLATFHKPKLTVEDVHTLADLKRYRKQHGGSNAELDLTPEQCDHIGMILWAEMKAHPKQLERVLRDHPDMTEEDVKEWCGVRRLVQEPEEIAGSSAVGVPLTEAP
jgi:Spy/CpxP family protein refolding chaperone